MEGPHSSDSCLVIHICWKVEREAKMDPPIHTEERRLEEGLWGTESFIANCDDLSIGQFKGFLQGGGGSGSCHFLFEVKSNVAELFLDITDNFTLSGGGERVASLAH